MNPHGDSSHEMLHFPLLLNRYRLDEATAERLVTGQVGPDDAPPAYAGVARVLAAAVGPEQAREVQGESAAIAMFAAQHRALVPDPRARGRRRMLPQILTTKAAAAALTGAIVFGGGVTAAAAAGHLPDAAQNVAHDSLAHVGISIPAGADAPPDTKGQDIKTTAQDPTTSGQDKGQAVCAQASDGQCRAGQEPSTEPTEPTESDGGQSDSPHTPVGPPTSLPAGPPTTHPTGPPTSHPTGPPTSHPSGPPASVPVGPPASVPARSGH